jgi:hypothetical protein
MAARATARFAHYVGFGSKLDDSYPPVLWGQINAGTPLFAIPVLEPAGRSKKWIRFRKGRRI